MLTTYLPKHCPTISRSTQKGTKGNITVITNYLIIKQKQKSQSRKICVQLLNDELNADDNLGPNCKLKPLAGQLGTQTCVPS